MKLVFTILHRLPSLLLLGVLSLNLACSEDPAPYDSGDDKQRKTFPTGPLYGLYQVQSFSCSSSDQDLESPEPDYYDVVNAALSKKALQFKFSKSSLTWVDVPATMAYYYWTSSDSIDCVITRTAQISFDSASKLKLLSSPTTQCTAQCEAYLPNCASIPASEFYWHQNDEFEILKLRDGVYAFPLPYEPKTCIDQKTSSSFSVYLILQEASNDYTGT